MAAVANYHTLIGLKQYKCIIFQFCRSEVLKSRCRQGCIPSGDCRGESVSLPFPPSGCHPHSLTHGTTPLWPLFLSSSLHLWPSCLPLISTLVIALSHLGNRGYLYISRSWTWSHQQSSFLLCKITYSRVPGIKTWHLWEALFNLPHHIPRSWDIRPCFSYLLLSNYIFTFLDDLGVWLRH